MNAPATRGLADQRRPMAGGMRRLRAEELRNAPINGLVRLAVWLKLEVGGPHPTERAHRRALMLAIVAAEMRLAGAARAGR